MVGSGPRARSGGALEVVRLAGAEDGAVDTVGKGREAHGELVEGQIARAAREERLHAIPVGGDVFAGRAIGVRPGGVGERALGDDPDAGSVRGGNGGEQRLLVDEVGGIR